MVNSQVLVSSDAFQDVASSGTIEPSASMRVRPSNILRKTLTPIGEVSSIGSSVRTSEPCDTTIVLLSAAKAEKGRAASKAVPVSAIPGRKVRRDIGIVDLLRVRSPAFSLSLSLSLSIIDRGGLSSTAQAGGQCRRFEVPTAASGELV